MVCKFLDCPPTPRRGRGGEGPPAPLRGSPWREAEGYEDSPFLARGSLPATFPPAAPFTKTRTGLTPATRGCPVFADLAACSPVGPARPVGSTSAAGRRRRGHRHRHQHPAAPGSVCVGSEQRASPAASAAGAPRSFPRHPHNARALLPRSAPVGDRAFAFGDRPP
eukprot:scaffold693_cov399-Prasinococcus_capsulatus_cf.AAC.13